MLGGVTNHEYLVNEGKNLLEKITSEVRPNDLDWYTTVLSSRLDKNLSNYLLENKDLFHKLMANTPVFEVDYLAVNTLNRGYLLKTTYDGDPLENLHYMFLRIAAYLYYPNTEKVVRCFQEMCRGDYIHATPTLLNAGTNNHQLASCFLMKVDDSLEDIMEKLKQAAIVSKHHGGIGVDFTALRHSEIRKVGKSKGILPICKMWNEMMRFVDQLGTRKGAATVFLNPFHIDIMEFLELPLKTGPHDQRAIDLTYGLMMPDLLYERAKKKSTWSLFCPTSVPKLLETYGKEFESWYEYYEKDPSIQRKEVDAQSLFKKIASTQRQTGMPFILNRDTINSSNMQENVGIVSNSNLCVEIVEVCSYDDIASCNLASINLSNMVKEGQVDFPRLREAVHSVVENLNQVIDRNLYVLEGIKKNNSKTRPIGIGVSGFADLLFKLNLSFESKETKNINKKLFAAIYMFALEKSMELAKEQGPYEMFPNSPLSRGEFHFERSPYHIKIPAYGTKKEWSALKENIMKYGVRNSLLVALMPTATSANILGNTESIEPITSNVFSKRLMNGRYIVINKYLEKLLRYKGVFSNELIKEISEKNGSIQTIGGIFTDEEKEIYKTAFEINMKVLIELMANRAPYVDQSASFNWFLVDPSDREIISNMFQCWKQGLKTSMYYLHQKPATLPQSFSCSSFCSSCSL